MTQTPASPVRVLGKGLALSSTDPGQDIGLDIAFGGVDGRRDLATVTGHDALLQDLRVALCTGLGTDPLNRGFGSDAFAAMAEESDPMLMRERIRVAVIRVLKADPRVRRVVEVRVGGEAQPFAGTARATTLDITATYETALSELASIAIEGLSDA